MADWHGFVSKSSKSSDEFGEEDVWSFGNEIEDKSCQMTKEYSSSGSSSAWRCHSCPRMIRSSSKMPTAANEANKGSQQSSSPVNIPDWSKIYGKNANLGSSSRNGAWVHGHTSGVVCSNGDYHDYDGDDNEDDDDDDDGDTVPPHEWLSKKLARNQISSFSVCEGIGRTLKGRDLRKVRNAVLSKTGFLE